MICLLFECLFVKNQNKANKQQYWCSHFLMLHVDDTMARIAEYRPKFILVFFYLAMSCPFIGPIFWPVQIILDPYKLYWTRPKTNFHFWILQFDLFPKRFGPIEGQGISARCVVWFANKVYHFVTTNKCTETYFGLNQYVLDLVQNIKFNS